jgi:serine/threonine protein phosphatase PrpC
VTVPASAVVSAPADKVKSTPPAADSGKSEPPPKDDARLGTAVAERSGDTALASRGAEPAATPDRSAGGESGVALRFPPQSKTPSAPAPTTPPKPATWKNLPAKDPWCPPAIAAQAPELRKVAAADAVAFERVLPGWRAAGASRRGRMHANGGTHREDSLAFDAHDRATVLCVSDGAGSCQHSRIGSHVAAHRVVEILLAATEKVDPALATDATKLQEHLKARVTEAVLAATDALLDLAKKSGCAPKDFRCTLLTALHYRGESHELLLTNQIGDGAICLLRKDQSTARLGSSDSGTHSGEVSCFVPDDCARVKAKAVEVTADVAAIECVLLCSDGIEDPFYPLEKQAVDIFRQYYAGVDKPLKDFKSQLPQPAPLLQESAAWGLSQWLEFEKRGENDDRTVAVLHRQPVNVSY